MEKKVQRIELLTNEYAERLDKKIDDNHVDMEIRFEGANDKINDTNNRISDFKALHETTLENFRLVKKDFAENNEMLTINLKKMGKDKRGFTEKLMKNFDLLMSAENQIELLKAFSVQIATLVNHLRTAEEIDMCLYAQDEKDRQMTVLYGINEEAGKGDVKAETPI